jgi:hypothetical protein
LENAKNNLVRIPFWGLHASLPQKPVVKNIEVRENKQILEYIQLFFKDYIV